MYLINTTFHIHSSITDTFMQWMDENYVSALAGSFGDVLFTRILINVDPEALSFAVQVKVPTLDDFRRWDEATGAALRGAFGRKAGDKFLFFTTEMEIIVP